MDITRFAPSPTGLLHVGSIRPALVNYLFARKAAGKFILRIDDTDVVRSTEYFKQELLNDLAWLGIEWDEIFYQSERLSRYQQVFKNLVAQGFIYPCFETPQELDIKRKTQLHSGKPPIYDRAALRLSDEQKAQYLAQNRKAHYRFKLQNKEIIWHDLIRGRGSYQASNLSDPIIVREDATFTYMLCSAIDDFDYKISHIFRGEDHINNTAIQLQMFQAIGANMPEIGHLSFLKAKDEKISKREGGFEVKKLSSEGIEPMTVNSFFAYTGTSKPVIAKHKMQELVEDFDVSCFSASPSIYNPQEILLLNHKLLVDLTYQEVKESLDKLDLAKIDENFWLAIRPNLRYLKDAQFWWDICHGEIVVNNAAQDLEFLKIACSLLPEGQFTIKTWSDWTESIANATNRKGKQLYMPIRLALTGLIHGPEMGALLPLIPREVVICRLSV